MLNYFDPVETALEGTKATILAVIGKVAMMIGVVADPEFSESDRRLDLLWDIVESTGALVFNGDAILDSQGNRVLDHSGDCDVIV